LERFTQALFDLILEQGGAREWSQSQNQLLAHYERVARRHKDLRLGENYQRGRMAVGAVGILAQRSADWVGEVVKKALASKGYDPRLIQLAAEQVREQLLTEVKEKP
jgi:hypothetical protein